MKKTLLTGSLIIIAILAILPFWAGYKAQSQIEQQLANFNQRIAPFGVQIEISDYQRGYLSSDLNIDALVDDERKSSTIHIDHAPLTFTGLDIAHATSNNADAPTDVHYSITGQLDIEQVIPAYDQFPGGKLVWQGDAGQFPDAGRVQLDIPAIHIVDGELDVTLTPINLSANIEEQQITIRLPEFHLNIQSDESETLSYHYKGIEATIPLQTIAGQKYALGANIHIDSIEYGFQPSMHLHIAPYAAEVGFRPDGDERYTFSYITDLNNIDLDIDTASMGFSPEMAEYSSLVPKTFHTDISISGLSADSVATIANFVAISFSPTAFNMDSVERDNYFEDYFDNKLQPVLQQNLFDEDMRLSIDINARNEQHQLLINALGIEHIHNNEELEAAQNVVQLDNLIFDGSHANISISADFFDHPILQQFGITPPSELKLSEDGKTYQFSAEIRDGQSYTNGEATEL